MRLCVRVVETVADDVAGNAHFKPDQTAPIATIADLERHDAIVVDTGARFGRISSQRASFLDQAGPLWRGDAFEWQRVAQHFHLAFSSPEGNSSKFGIGGKPKSRLFKKLRMAQSLHWQERC